MVSGADDCIPIQIRWTAVSVPAAMLLFTHQVRIYPSEFDLGRRIKYCDDVKLLNNKIWKR